MSSVAEKTSLTAEEFLRMPSQSEFELVDGELLERHVSTLSGWVGGEIFGLIREHCRHHQLGWVFPCEVGIQCFPDRPRTVRKPDAFFVKSARLSSEDLGDGWLKMVPDLIVEVISPQDLSDEVEEKIEMFHKAGVPLIWVISLSARNVRVLRANGSISLLREGDLISGEDILPGFSIPVGSIFPPKSSEV
jgi:Uma2 family endonuclease